ncbi:23S rRNA (guanosine(2251)-2'-O)-methyltransferase RlmB [Aureibacter tunicatorum]|uniref:23S rRNA (Guanosine2251-2'-O)-methyltransferase n=1 Tax=Aureibacter tunicatorum TaxID=866807 RepID=A0AAE4BS97_9BACT|nr:23S rRNA (guanosine(2251)-2'-O)-methyltransferase RlmB [Aureibacter tunicatorum]MDR6238645.1 23S rRNA (guanosine2251-2'-O)-methyltransferase [Aureibacter tunicatorum]BDD05424.1 23S rRNA (guanosine(2251)-2'-O)-methyltransferase RlmB [Aureibacter tunicatorum]
MEKRPKRNIAFPKNKKDNIEMVFGIRAILESINSGKEIEKLFIQTGINNELIKELIQTAKNRKIPFVKVPQEKLNRITKKNHQGAIAYLSAIKYLPLENIIYQIFEKGEDPFLLILDRITDVRNFGAIARTAECLGVHAIIIPSRGAAQANSDAIKTSAGALNYIPVCREDNLKETIQYLKDSGINIVASTEKTDTSILDVEMNGPVAIIMGSEENGISNEYLKLADQRAKIPMTGKIESLNVSVAAGMMLYEAVKQRSKN